MSAHCSGKAWVKVYGPADRGGIYQSPGAIARVPGRTTLLSAGSTDTFGYGGAAAVEEYGTARAAQPATARFSAVTAAAGNGWRQIPIPASVRPLAGLNAVAATGAHDAWAVGHELQGELAPGYPLTLRWTGTAWRRVPTGQRWQGDLTGVAADSPRDAWAIGADAAGHPRVLHWNGRSWHAVRFPGHSAVAVTAAGGHAWIAGRVNAVGASAIFEWAGRGWTPAQVPGEPSPLRARSASDVWAPGADGTFGPSLPPPAHTC